MARPPKQTEIPGAERVHFADIEAAADELVEAREDAKGKKDHEKACMARLLNLMRKHKLEVLRLADNRIVRVKPGEDKVKVEKPKKARGRRRGGFGG